MMVRAMVGIADMQAALEEFGATVAWPEEALPRIAGRAIEMQEAEVDNSEAYEALPSSFFDHDDLEPNDVADARDVGDFVRAVARGDRLMAGALCSRLWPSPRNQLAFEIAAQRSFAL